VPEKALEEWAVASEKEDYNREEFCKAFRRKYEGVRSNDIDILVQTFKVSLMTADPMNPTLEKEKAKEQATAPMNPILLEGKEKDKAPSLLAPSTSTTSSTPHAKKRKGSGEDPRPKKRSKKEKRERQPKQAPEPAPEPAPKPTPEPAPEPAPEPELEPEQGHLEPPPDSVGANTRAITPWIKVESKLGGVVWERKIEVSPRDGTTYTEVQYNHKDESTKHLPNYPGSRKWSKYNQDGKTHGGRR
jgi:hypothetical protein